MNVGTRAGAVAVAVGTLLVLWLAPTGSAGAATIYSYQAQARLAQHISRGESATQISPRAQSAAHAPSGPPLSAPVSRAEQTISSVPSSEGDPLVDNGLSSPLCKDPAAGLSRTAQEDCHTSGFLAASAPTKSYEIDVNIDVGPTGLSKGSLLSVIQDMFVTPLWSALVWVVHALVVMLEWCYTLNLLQGPTMTGVARVLRQAQASFTQPWLALVLAAASVLALYNGLVRRRITETLGQVLVTVAMMAGGLWVIADPLGTVGAVGQWADEASLGTLGAVAQGTPTSAPRTLADSMRALFEGAIEMPWCYLEFGNVRWCSDPALLDSRLQKAGLLIEARQKAMIGCKPTTVAQLCAAAGSPAALVVERSDRLMRQATTNGALFLAFSANGPERNSVTEQGSLLHVLCQAADDTKCTGSTAAQAEFRSASGTFPRLIGLALIAVGVLGMLMLFGLIALRLFGAAIVSLFMLLLAPAAVLAPALGDSGRAVFSAWFARLLGAVSSKLIYSFLLGVVLMMQRILSSLQPLGWWTEWLLISAFWWAVFLRRHQATAFLQSGGRQPIARERRPLTRQIESARQAHNAVSRPMSWARRKLFGPGSPNEELDKRSPAERIPASRRMRGSRARPQRRPGNHANMRKAAAQNPATRMLATREQLERVRAAHEVALVAGDRRRVAKLAARKHRLEAELASAQLSQHQASRDVPGAEDPKRASDSVHADERSERRERLGIGGDSRRIEQSPPESVVVPPRAPDQRSLPDARPRASDMRPRASDTPASPNPDLPTPNSRAPAMGQNARSTIMEDARAVAERRKRQLGFEPPSADNSTP